MQQRHRYLTFAVAGVHRGHQAIVQEYLHRAQGPPVQARDRLTIEPESFARMRIERCGQGQYVEVQGSGEESTFSNSELMLLLELAQAGIAELTKHQRTALGDDWPFRSC